MTDRRDFLHLLGAGVIGACTPGCAPATPAPPAGELLGTSAALGHRLRSGGFPEPERRERHAVLIIGGGIAGLSAARQLARHGLDDFLLLELEDSVGGNARGGNSPVSAHPWGAHYLPLPGSEGEAIRELLHELGALQGDPQARRPHYDETRLCAAPQERLYRHGSWEDGLLPRRGASPDELAQQGRFLDHMQRLRDTRGRDGRRVFALPIARASRDPDWLALDRQNFADWLNNNGYTAPSLHWLANYACRDDYGTEHRETSAWAGLHYFACRNGEAANASPDTVLTAADGNAWLARGLAAPLGDRLHTGALCWRLQRERHQVVADVFYPARGESVRHLAADLIWAAPLFLLPRLCPDLPGELAGALDGDYAPWLTANLHLDRRPTERHGAPPAWDNVLHDGPGLGYVIATHQQMRRHSGPTILTYYRTLSELSPAAGRRLLEQTPHATWATAIVDELSRPHPDLRECVSRIDIFRFGHAMRRPHPGRLWDGRREALANARLGRLHLAHSDLSGLSLFEEAFAQGQAAASRLLARRGLPVRAPLEG